MTELTNDHLAADFKIVIYCPFNKPTENIFGHEVHYLNSNQFDRWDAFKMFPESWLCFLDADCTLDEKLILQFRKELLYLNTSTVLCGRYKTENRASTLTHAYNTLCNTWLEAGLLVNEPRVLGGIFVIYSSQNLRSVEFERHPKWGAEDYRMARRLGNHNFNFKMSDDLQTTHQPKNDLNWYFKRAWIHGNHRPDDVHLNLIHWINMLVRQNLFSATYILMHFGTVFVSKTYNKTIKNTELVKLLWGFVSKERPNSQRT